MTPSSSRPLLRVALLADAAISGATGLLMALAAGPLAGITGLPPGLLRGAGLVLLPFALGVAWLAHRDPVPRSGVGAVIALNGLWALGCVALLAGGPLTPTALGYAFVLLQAAAVALLAVAQAAGLQRAPGPRIA